MLLNKFCNNTMSGKILLVFYLYISERENFLHLLLSLYAEGEICQRYNLNQRNFRKSKVFL